MRIRLLTRADVTIKVVADTEEIPPEGQFASGDDEQDRKDCAEIRRDLADGNPWAWCCACVRVQWGDFAHTEYLGCSSYVDEADFRACDYFTDMVDTCITELNAEVARAFRTFASLVIEGAQ